MSAIDISTKYPPVRNYIGGAFIDGEGYNHLDVTNPADGSVISRVPLSPATAVDRAVQAAKSAFPAWSSLPIKERVQIFFRYKTLLEQNIDELSALITEENGKVDSEARAEILKSAELTEFACSLPQITAGEVLEVSRGVECRVERFPVGIVASITPFNFPNMVPNWTIPNAIALGNCLIVMPDAEPEMTSSNVVASMSGCAGQRCMAASVMVSVGNTDHIINRMVSIMRGVKTGPVISKEAKQRIESSITEAEKAGAKVL